MSKYDEFCSSRDVLAELVRRYVGSGRPLSVEEVAAECGCSVENVYVARRGGVVSHDVAIRIVRALPDEAGVEYIRRCLGFTQSVRIKSADGCHHEAGRELAGATADYVDAASDGHIDHRESIKLTQRYFRVIAALSRVTAAVHRHRSA